MCPEHNPLRLTLAHPSDFEFQSQLRHKLLNHLCQFADKQWPITYTLYHIQFNSQFNSMQFTSLHSNSYYIDINYVQIIVQQFLTHHWDLLTSDTRPGGRALGHHFCFPKDSMSFFWGSIEALVWNDGKFKRTVMKIDNFI